jgi:XXXCH domain-containing protein
VKVREKKGRIESKMGWSWSTLGDYDSKAREEVSDWRNSMKSAKKLMSRSFKEVSKSAESGNMPGKEALKGLVDSSKAFMKFAEPEWQEAMEEFMDHLRNLEHAIDTGDIDVVLHEIRDLRYRKQACHREYK